MVHIGNAGPAASVEWHAQQQFARGDAGIEIRIDRKFNEEIVWNQARAEQRSVMIGRRLPGSVIVIALDVEEIDLPRDSGKFDVRKVLLTSRGGDGQQVVSMVGFSQFIQLLA